MTALERFTETLRDLFGYARCSPDGAAFVILAGATATALPCLRARLEPYRGGWRLLIDGKQWSVSETRSQALFMTTWPDGKKRLRDLAAAARAAPTVQWADAFRADLADPSGNLAKACDHLRAALEKAVVCRMVWALCEADDVPGVSFVPEAPAYGCDQPAVGLVRDHDTAGWSLIWLEGGAAPIVGGSTPIEALEAGVAAFADPAFAEAL